MRPYQNAVCNYNNGQSKSDPSGFINKCTLLGKK